MSQRGWGVGIGVVGAVAFVAGVVVGGIGPRGEVRALQAQVFELERERMRAGAETRRQFTDLITRGLNTDEGADASSEDPTRRVVTPEDGGEPIRVVDPGTPATPEEVAVDRPPGPDETMQAAREALEIRGAAARAALFEDVAPYGDQEAQLENAIAAMNDDLEAIAYDFVQMVEGGTEPSRREAMALGADVLDVLVSTEETMLSVLDDAQRASVREEATDPTAFVDPRVLDIVAELEPTP